MTDPGNYSIGIRTVLEGRVPIIPIVTILSYNRLNIKNIFQHGQAQSPEIH